MSAVINMKQKNLGMDYLKRTAGYISGAVNSYISDAMPVTTSTLRDAKQGMSEVHSTFAHTAQSILPKAREIRRQIGFRNISDWFNQKEDEFSEGFNDSEMDFDIPVDDVAAEAQLTELAETGNQISRAVVESAHRSVEAQMEATANLTTSMSELTSVVSTGFDQTNKLLSKMLEMLSKNTATLIEATVSNHSGSKPDQDMITSGRFSLGDYKKIVASNIKNSEFGMFASMLPMLASPDMIRMALSPQELIKSGLEFGLSKASPNLKKNLNALDSAVSETILDSLIRLGEDRGFGERGLLGRLFGLDSSRKETDTSRSKLELKPVSYDTISKEALTNAIPGYLRQILVAVGGPDLIYDYRSRSFKSKEKVRREFHDAGSMGGSLWNASESVRNTIGTSRFNQMSYDLMINDLSTKTDYGRGRKQVDKFRNYQEAEDYVLNVLYGGRLTSEEDIAEAREFAQALSRIAPGKLHDITNQVARSNVTRSKRMQQYARTADQYNVDLSEFTDSAAEIAKAIQESYGRTDLASTTSSDTAEIKRGEPTLYSNKGLSGVNYTNIALYEIYRRLNEGINVFKTGESRKLTRTPYEKWGDDRLPRPKDYKPKQGTGPSTKGEDTAVIRGTSPRDPDDPNLLHNQTLEDGTEEDLTKGQRFGRWGKKRGGDLAHAIFSGDPDQVRTAFGAIVGDVSEVASDGVKNGISKINDSFGNVTGYLKHKMFGTQYTYTEKDEDGNPVTKIVEKNDDGGIFGFVGKKFTSMFDDAKEKGSKWFQSVSRYFDYGDKDDSADIKSKRKRLLNTSVGALAGAGLLGGPIGLIMGAVAGNALSATGFGDRIKGFLFGRDEKGKAKGLLTRVGDSIVDPIRYQMGKSVEHVGNILKKNILGPLSDIGAAIHDRITSTATSTFGKLFTTIGNIILAPFKGIGKTLISAAKLPITLAGNLFRGITGIESGAAGGLMNMTASLIAGKSTHKVKREDGTVEEISTREWLRERRKERAEEVKTSKSESKYSDYKTWKEQAHTKDAEDLAALRRATFETVRDYDPEKDGTAEIKGDTEEIKESAARQADDTAEIKDSVGKMAEEALTKGSLYTHDDGLHSRVDQIIDLLGGKTTQDNKVPEDAVATITDTPESIQSATPSIPSGVKSDKEKRKEENAAYGSALFSSGATLADEGGVDDRDVNSLEKMAQGMDGSETKASMFGRFRDLLSRNQDKADSQAEVAEKKEESFLSRLVGGIGEVAGGLLSKGWPLILGGLTLFSDKFRDLLFGEDGLLPKAADWILNTALPAAGKWLSENLPSILSGIWNGAEAVNQAIENQATGATTVIDPVTNERKSVISAEKHAEDIENGIVNTAIDNTMDPLRLLKDTAVIAGERTLLRGTAGAVAASGGIANIGGNIVNAGSTVFQGLTNSAKSFLGNTIFKGTTTGLNLTSSAATTAVTGNAAAQTVAAGGATVQSTAGGIKSMFGKITDPKTWLNLKAIGNIVGGVASDISAGIGWESAEIAKNGNIVGDYGLGSAGGFVQTSTTAKTITTTTIGVAGGIAIGQAVAAAGAAITAAGGLAAVGTANFWNPVGWCALIIAGVLAAAAGIAALVNLLVGIATDNSDKDYAVRSNASKLNGVIKGEISYTNGADNPMYVYCGQESDRVLGLTKGLNVKDPDLMFGKFLRQIADGLVSSPGTEVLLYDLINNMAVQGVPFAVRVAGDSREAKCDGAQANTNTTGTPPADRTGPMGGKYCTVKKSTVRKYIDEIFADIAANVGRQDKNAIFTEDNVQYVYDAGKDVVKQLKKKGILDDNGKVQTKKFKGTPGSGKNDDGWTALDEICRDEGSYFLTKCLVYINSKIEANKSGQQWLEERKDDVVKLLDGLKDLFMKEGEEQVAAMREQGMSDKEIEETLKNAVDPKGNQATGAAELATSEAPASFNITSSGIRSEDKADVTKELKYLSAAYAYSHPDVLQSWVQKNQKKSGVNVDYVNSITNWNSFSTDKRKKATLRSQMINAALQYGDEAGDIFNLVPQFDWSSSGNMLKDGSKSPGEKYGTAFIIRGEKKKKGEGILDKLFESANPSEKTPEDVHKLVFGKKTHGDASEATTTKDQDLTVSGSGVIARIANFIKDYGSAQGLNLTAGSSKDKWRNVLLNIPAYAPPNLPKGGATEEAEAEIDNAKGGPVSPVDEMWDRNSKSDEEKTADTAVVKEGGNPLNKAFGISSKYGWRTLDKGKEFHAGIDMYPTDGSKQAEVGARFNGTIKSVQNGVTYSGLNTPSKYSAGNYVTYETDSGLTIKNFHLKNGSIPSNIKPGARVSVGDKLGDMGSTGRSTGPHLHYQMESPNAKDAKGNHTFDPTSSVTDGDTLSTFNSYGYSGTSSDSAIYSDGTSSDTGSSSATGLAGLIEFLKTVGTEFLNKITGGLFGNPSSTSSSDSTGIASLNYGTNGSLEYNGITINSSTITNVDDFLAMVAKEIGTKEQPANSNKVKYNEWFYGKPVSGDSYPWCMAFVQYCFDRAGLPLECKTAGCTTLRDWYKENHPELLFTAGTGTPKPGDIAIFISGNTCKHTGIIEKVTDNKHITTIEGNTSSGASGSQDNGGCVARKQRETPYFGYYIRAVDWEALDKAVKASASAMANVGDGAESMFMYLKSIGYSDEAAAAVVGCWEHESTNTPKRVESDYLSDFKNTFGGDYDKVANNIPLFNEYSARVAKGRSGYIDKRDGKNYAGLGYAQWTGGRSRNLLDFAKKNNAKWYEAGTQLAFMDSELKGSYQKTYANLTAAKDIESATKSFAYGYEHGSMPADMYNARLQTAKAIYAKLKGKYTSSNVTATEFGTQTNVGGPKMDPDIQKDYPETNETADLITPSKKHTTSQTSFGGVGGPVSEGPSVITSSGFTKAPTSKVTKNQKTTDYTSSLNPTPATTSFFKETGSSTTEPSSYAPNVTSGDDLSAVVELLQEAISYLATITGNTGTSNSLLEAINGKEFKDQGLRDSLSKLKDVPKKTSYARHSGQLTAGNKRAIAAMARP